MSVARRLLVAVATAALLAVALASCGGGGGGATTGTTAAAHQSVRPGLLTEKLGLVPIGGGRYRVGDCVADAVLASRAAIDRRKEAGKNVIVTPTGNIGIETGAGPRCTKVMKEVVALLNVP